MKHFGKLAVFLALMTLAVVEGFMVWNVYGPMILTPLVYLFIGIGTLTGLVIYTVFNPEWTIPVQGVAKQVDMLGLSLGQAIVFTFMPVFMFLILL